MADLIGLGGRVFTTPESRSSRQDGWIMVQLEDAKLLGSVLGGLKELGNENAARKLIIEAMRSGKFHHIAAGLLVDITAEKWTADAAEKNAEFFAELTSDEDKTAIMMAFVETLTRFFTTGVRSLTPSPTASPSTTASAAPPTPRTRGKRSTATRAGSGPTPHDGSPTATAST